MKQLDRSLQSPGMLQEQVEGRSGKRISRPLKKLANGLTPKSDKTHDTVLGRCQLPVRSKVPSGENQRSAIAGKSRDRYKVRYRYGPSGPWGCNGLALVRGHTFSASYLLAGLEESSRNVVVDHST